MPRLQSRPGALKRSGVILRSDVPRGPRHRRAHDDLVVCGASEEALAPILLRGSAYPSPDCRSAPRTVDIEAGQPLEQAPSGRSASGGRPGRVAEERRCRGGRCPSSRVPPTGWLPAIRGYCCEKADTAPSFGHPSLPGDLAGGWPVAGYGAGSPGGSPHAGPGRCRGS